MLLLQDLAIVPLLAVIPLLAEQAPHDTTTAFEDFLVAIGAIAALFAAGRYLLNPLFQVIARTGAREAMIAAALFVVLAAAMLLQMAGLSMAMGAFLAGVLLADSSYRHELQADVEPFRGILLGLFFMAVGLSLHLDVVFSSWLTILIATPAVMLVKASSSTASAASPGPRTMMRCASRSCCRKAASSASCCSPRRRPPASFPAASPRC